MAGTVSTLEDRVAALEEAIRFPLKTAYFPSDEDVVQFREEFDRAARQPYRVLPQPPPLSPDEVRQLLRECVTVVKPGETLVIRGRNWTPRQVHEIQQAMNVMHEDGAIPFKVLAVFGDELAIAEDAERLEVLTASDLAGETFSRGGRTWKVFACARCGARKLDFEVFQTADGRTWCLWPDHVPAPVPEEASGAT